MRVAHAIGTALTQLGVEHVFGVVGSGNFAVTNAMCASGARFIAARHECAAVCMADGYARASGRLGVATVHQGPGLTNATTGIAEAAKSRTPLVLLAADTSTAAVRSNFRIDQQALATAVDAVSERLHTPESALADLARAHHRAIVERRTVVLNLPLDVQAGSAPTDATLPSMPRLARPAPDAATVREVVGLLEAAERPAIIAGRGAVQSGAHRALERLGAQLGAILATSANANGLFAGNPYAIGIAGGFASPFGAKLLMEADLVLAFGASLNMWTTRHGTLVGPNTRVVQVDVDSAAIGARRPVDVGIPADATATAEALTAELERRGYENAGFRVGDLESRIARGGWRDERYEDASTEDTIDPRMLSATLERLLPRERTLAIDSGHFMGWPAMYLAVPDPEGFIFNQSFQSIGLGLGAAIGAAVARPDRITVAALGDGGAFMALGEFETAVRLGLPMLILVYNDAAYGAEVHHFGPNGDPVDIVRFPDSDFAALGRAVGAEGITVRAPDDLEYVAEWAKQPPRPLVVDAKVTPTVVAEWLQDAFRAH